MRRSRFAQAGFIVLFVAGCSSTGTPPPTAVTPAAAAAAPTAVLGSPTPIATPSPSLSPSLSPSPTPLTTANGWQQVPTQAALVADQTSIVTWTGQRFLAAGILDDGSAGILDSSDGQTWHSQASFGPGSRINQFSVGPAGVLAVGSQGSKARSWFSTDGLAWTAAPASAATTPAKGHTVRMNAATATTSGFLAVGEEDITCNIDCGLWAAVRADVWTSSDGLHWTLEPASTALANAGMSGIVRGGPGYVAVGGAPNGAALTSGPVHAVMWTSTDGRNWSRIKDAPIFHPPAGIDSSLDVSASSIATDGSHFAAVGEGASQDLTTALAWWSDDGRTWQRATGERFQYGQLWQVASVPGGFLGAGPSGPDSCLGGIWSSADGRAWSCIAADPPFEDIVATDAAASPTLELVVGYDANGGDSILWTRPVP
jgi:hypothetical protein